MASQPHYRAGLVGAGYISEYHVAALRRLPNVELLGVVDVDPARAARAAERFGTRAFPSIEALRDAGADVIHVLTPPHTHAAVAETALRLGCHVLVEKPLADDVEDCRRLDQLARSRGLSLCVNHSLLFDPQVRRALEVVRSGRLGRVISVDILRSSVYPPYAGGRLPPQYRTGGYPFRDLGVHALYLFQAFLGPIQRVEADWRSLGGDPDLAFDEWRALVRCRDGLGQFQLSWNVRPIQNQIVLQGTRGVLRVDLFLMFQALRAATPLPKAIERVLNALTDSLQPLGEVPVGVWRFLRKKTLPYHGLQDLVAAFYRSLAEGGPPPVPAAEAIPVVDWVERVARRADEEHDRMRRRYAPGGEVPVLVTGASGGLGSAVVERLVREGCRVRAFVRRPPPNLPEGVEVVLGNLGDPEAVDRAVRGARVVIHAGAAMKGGWEAHACGTVRGTENVVAACRKHGVEKLVHISSLSVVDWAGSHDGSPVTEETALEPQPERRGSYTRAKLAAEREVARAARDGLPAVILRPGQIFGGRIPLLTPAIARRWGRRWVVLGDGRLRLPLVYLDDVVDAVLLAMRAPLRGGEVIQIVDPEPLTQNEVLELALGPGAPVLRIPRPLVFCVGKLSEWLLRPLGRTSPLSVYRLRSALARLTFGPGRAEERLGWKPRVGVREGIRRVTGEQPVEARSRPEPAVVASGVPETGG